MYSYIGILTASLLVFTNADPVLMPPVELSYDSPYGPNVTIDEERGGKAAIAIALIKLGGKLIIDEHKGTKVNFWEYRGNYIIESECWEDGSGPCANGNCLDNNGRRGMKIQEISIKCAWFCVHRTHCRLQTCCPFTNKRPHTGGGNGGNPSTAWRLKGNADCWKHCGEKGGSCPNFCGNNAYCCRKGFGGCPVEAAEVSPNYHTCVQRTAWRQKNNADCWKNCGEKGGSCPNFCGHNAYCCRKGFGGCPAGSAEVSPNYHTCVQQTAWRQKSNADCWKNCGEKGGSCPNFCGHNAYCCRKGFVGCPAGAAEVSPNYHTCVQQTAWRQKNNADCWKNCGQKGGSCPNFCGHNAYCCRKGFGGCPAGAAEVSPNYHTCVQKTG